LAGRDRLKSRMQLFNIADASSAVRTETAIDA